MSCGGGFWQLCGASVKVDALWPGASEARRLALDEGCEVLQRRVQTDLVILDRYAVRYVLAADRDVGAFRTSDELPGQSFLEQRNSS